MKRSKPLSCLLCLIILSSCDPKQPRVKSSYALICARNGSDRPIYRVNVPKEWKQKNLNDIKDKTDTKLPICEFTVGGIRVTIHSFPSELQTDRIPPMAQIERWKTQFNSLESVTVTPQAFSGYSGFVFEGSGFVNKVPQSVMAWTMQLANEHYRLLQDPQKKGDFTIKIVGPPEEINSRRKEIIAFSRSFELIDEIPEQL